MDIIFMGSSEYSCAVLRELLKIKKYNIVSIYTREPKPGNRKKLTKTPVHEFAESVGLSVRTPASLKSETLENCDVIVVVAYGLILPQRIIEHPKIACINIHPSLLPRWRGAAPIQHAILAGDKETGVSIMEVTKELDAGDVYLQRKIKIEEHDDYQSLNGKLIELGISMLIDVLSRIREIAPIPQSELGSNITYADKVPNSYTLDTSQCVEKEIRKLKTTGKLVTEILGKNVGILKAHYEVLSVNPNEVGSVKINTSDEIQIFCANGILFPDVIQPSGGKPMSAQSFLNGCRIP